MKTNANGHRVCIQELLGYSSLNTTAIHNKASRNALANITEPLDQVINGDD